MSVYIFIYDNIYTYIYQILKHKKMWVMWTSWDVKFIRKKPRSRWILFKLYQFESHTKSIAPL